MKNKKLFILTTSILLGMASIGGMLMSCGPDTPEVVPVDNKIVITAKKEVLDVNEDFTFKAQLNGSDAEVKWSCDKKSVLSIDSSTGEAHAYAAGAATITASKEGAISASLTVIVQDSTLQSISVSGDNTVAAGGTITMEARSNGSILNDVIWSSSNSNIATVGAANGLVKGKSEGTCDIIASKTGYNSGKITITVTGGSVDEDGTHAISFKKMPGVTWNCSKTSAKKGESISFTVSASTGVTITNVKMNSQLLTDAAGTYSFTMPDEDVLITADQTIDSDVAVVGDMAFGLADDGSGLYMSNEITADRTLNLSFAVKNTLGDAQMLSITKMDYTKCFATINLSSTQSFELAGGFNYVFYYDSNNESTYIKRTSTVYLPTNENALSDLFDAGKYRYRYGLYPSDLKSATYKATGADSSGADYTFNRYQDNVSIANVTFADSSKDPNVVYKKYDAASKLYTVVDNYIEDDASEDPLVGSASKAFSGKFRVVADENSYTEGQKNYEITIKNALFDSTHNSHDMLSIENDIMDSYRVGFGTDEWMNHTLKSSSKSITSTQNVDSTFTTAISSWKTYDDNSNDFHCHYTYEVSLKFRNDGALLSGTYLEKTFGTDAYDMAGDKFLAGGESKGTIEKQLTFNYEYDSTLLAAPAFDTTPYFLSSITSINIGKEVYVDGTPNTSLNKNQDLTDVITVGSFSPATALDSWQYGITASSNTSVVKFLSEYRRWQVVGIGNANLTIGNHIDSTVTKSIELNILDGKPAWNVYVDASYGNVYEGVGESENSSSIKVYAGKASSRFTLRTGPTGSNNDIILSWSEGASDLISATYDPATYILTLDTSKAASITKETVVTMYAQTTNWDAASPTAIKVTIVPHASLTEEFIKGTWNYNVAEDDHVGKLEMLTDKITIKETVYNKAVLTITGARPGVIEFGWAINEDNELVIKSPDANEELDLSYDVEGDTLGVVWSTSELGVDESSGEMIENITIHTGSFDEDEDGGKTFYYDEYVKA